VKKNNGTRNVVRRCDVDRLKWTDERNKMLRDLLELGLSSAMAAQRMGISKNAVVGQAHRLGIVYGRTAKKEKSRQNIIPLPRSKKVAATAAVEGLKDVRKHTDEPVPIGAFASPPEDKACRWVHGDPATMTWRHCGHEQKANSVYCNHHHARSYHRAPYNGNVIPMKLGVKRR
jgi:GcrA cell cycle regulator